MRLSQFCKNELQAQYSFTYQAQYIAKKYMHFYFFIFFKYTNKKRWINYCKVRSILFGGTETESDTQEMYGTHIQVNIHSSDFFLLPH